MRRSTMAVGLLAAMTLAGCGMFSSDKDNKKNNRGGFNLTGDESAAFESWKGSLQKNCDASEAFEGEQAAGYAIDYQVLMAKLGNSLVVSNESGFAMLDVPMPEGGESTSTLSRHTSLNGNDSKFSARLERKGSNCKVYLGEELVYETNLVTNLPVQVFYQPGLEQASVTAYSSIQTRGQSGVLSTHRLFDVGTAFVGENLEHVAAFLSEPLGLKPETVNTYVQTSGMSYSASAQFKALPTVLPVSPGELSIYGGHNELRDVIGGAQQEMTLHIAKPFGTYGEVSNDQDPAVWQLSVDLTITEQADGPAKYTIAAIRLDGAVEEVDAQARRCFQQRYAGMQLLYTFNQPFTPGYGDVIAACGFYVENTSEALFADAATRQIVLDQFNGVAGRPGMSVGGWDEPLVDFARIVLAKGERIGETLDPQEQRPIVLSLSRYTHALAERLPSYPTLAPEAELLQNAMTSMWALYGRNPPVAKLDEVLPALNNSWDALQRSTDRLMGDLGRNPDEHDEALAAALNLNDELKAAIAALLADAEAAGVPSTIESAYLDDFLQENRTADDVARWQAVVTDLKAFYEADQARQGEMDMSFDSDYTEIAQRAISQEWRAPQYDQAFAITKLSPFRIMCDNRGSVSSRADCLGLSAFSTEQGKFFDPEFGDRYAKLANDLVDVLAGLDDPFLPNNIADDVFNPMWDRCSNEQFATKQKQLVKLIGDFKVADGLEEFEIKREIDDTLDNCN